MRYGYIHHQIIFVSPVWYYGLIQSAGNSLGDKFSLKVLVLANVFFGGGDDGMFICRPECLLEYLFHKDLTLIWNCYRNFLKLDN